MYSFYKKKKSRTIPNLEMPPQACVPMSPARWTFGRDGNVFDERAQDGFQVRTTFFRVGDRFVVRREDDLPVKTPLSGRKRIHLLRLWPLLTNVTTAWNFRVRTFKNVGAKPSCRRNSRTAVVRSPSFDTVTLVTLVTRGRLDEIFNSRARPLSSNRAQSNGSLSDHDRCRVWPRSVLKRRAKRVFATSFRVTASVSVANENAFDRGARYRSADSVWHVRISRATRVFPPARVDNGRWTNSSASNA